jgi:hypothetical protein
LLVRSDGGGYTVCLASWHMEFADERSAIGTFLGGLSEAYRLRVSSRGNVDYRWMIQYREGDGRINGSTVGIFRYPFWEKEENQIPSKQLISLPNQ